jgi:gluconokinase
VTSRHERAEAIVVMGVAGAGKTVVGRALADSLGWTFVDADDFHSPANVERMRRGIALTDADRAPWLAELRRLIARRLAERRPVVLACSALRRGYREELAAGAPERDMVRFVYLDVSPALAARRLERRRGHFMPGALIDSQFAALEEPDDALRIDGALPVEEIVMRVVRGLDDSARTLPPSG